MLNSVTPFFIVDDLTATIAFYQSKLGFGVRYKGGGDGNADADFWAILGRDKIMLMFKAITPEVHPQPNRSRHEWAPWDAYIYTDDPDSLYAEFVGREVPMVKELAKAYFRRFYVGSQVYLAQLRVEILLSILVGSANGLVVVAPLPCLRVAAKKHTD